MRWAAVTHDRTIVCMRARRLAANEGSLHVEDNRDLKSTSRVREPWGVRGKVRRHAGAVQGE